ncbi:DNA-J related domain-containing protein [Pseudomonas sp. M30-35]|uniref:DNA-J related domain-containing protein n=1 Tax=Pseudomonas sp. M30-35 TaxID=1981174 RepID=UPI000B3C8700|nr:DNA-J related domain-containing protein [Pseudomonas sp. M30-35]ARU87937.1 molecular chaperone DnaJ [Pseudomonas sp. M30-35]
MTDVLDPNLDLPEQLLSLLQAAPEGLSEYALIQQLKSLNSTHIPNVPLTDKLALFRTHFLLFNALYRLRDQLWQQQSADLHISAILIELRPFQVDPQSGQQTLGEHDPLRSYYLDMANLSGIEERDVEKLLVSFWTRMQGGDEKLAALELFELQNSTETLNLVRIKQRYRQLVSIHHPDRGGNTQRLQSINKAMEILTRYYQ